MFEQITKDNDVVNISTVENLNLKFWKYQNQKEFSRTLDVLVIVARKQDKKRRG